VTRTERLNTLELLKAWKREHDAVQSLMDGIEAGIGHIHPENKIFHTIWNLFDVYTQTLQIAIDDQGAWCQWYMAENDMGKGLEAGYDGKTTPIKNLAGLLRLIEESQRRT
jgi:hypothetical protein